uniref:C2H2-type domain-containing protein n=1 Tax=Plectus sambesii TaxID=2011161 RepID=A0A914V072_9BILA
MAASQNVHKESFPCPNCDSVLSNKNSLNTHRYKKHGGATRMTLKCAEENCDAKLATMQALKKHLQEKHDRLPDADSVNLEFEEEEEFRAWLHEIEQKTQAQFVLHRGGRELGDRSSFQYYCDRSGDRDKRVCGSGHNLTKTAKIGVTCSAHLSLVLFAN